MILFSLIFTAIFISMLIAIKQKIRGLNFWSSFFMSLIAIIGILGVIGTLLN